LKEEELVVRRIHCPACKREIRARDIDIRSKIAKCDPCNSVFDCSNQLPSGGANMTRETLSLPKGVTIDQVENGMQIIRRWFSPVILFLTFFCVFWDGFMIFWFYTSISQGAWMMAAFGTLHGLVGLGLTYFVIGGYINKTYITVSYDRLNVCHRPLPFPGNKTIARDELKQLYSKERISHTSNGTSVSYEVYALTHSGKKEKLLSGLTRSEEALFIEQEIEKYLGIRDETVPGEIPRV
jgi:hypothetical protein